MEKWKRVAERRMGASLSSKARSHTVCWKLLNRLRSPSTAVAIDSETLINHFEGVFYDPMEPLFFDLPALGIPSPSDFQINLFTDEELVVALRDLNSQAAVGPQGVASKVIKSVFSRQKQRVPLLILMNRCFLEGRIPAAWGYSEIFVLYKGKGDKKLAGNYRGINLNNDFLRLFERLLDQRFSAWIRANNPWGAHQFGFCSGASTEDAALCLQSLSRAFTRGRHQPLFANYIDLQRAFPSMLRSKILKVLYEMGVPYELIRAFAATFSGNSGRLRIGDGLTRIFLINRGTKEGGINSPKIFNTVYANALNQLKVEEFPMEMDDVDPNAVYYLVFADDLVLLSGNITRLEEVTNDLERVLEPLGMQVNDGKTKWMAFLPQTVPRGPVFNFQRHHSIQFNGHYLENVEEFVYLGFTMEWSLDKRSHRCRRERLQHIAAQTIGKLLRSLEVTNFISLRSYYMALVRSQLHSLSFSSFSEEEHDRAQKIFLQAVFSLPPSYPIQVATLLMGLNDFPLLFFDARTNFLSRLSSSGSIAAIGAMLIDRTDLLAHRMGWNWELSQAMGDLVNLSDVDLLNQVERQETRRRLASRLLTRRIERLRRSSSSFLLELFPSAIIPREFASFMGTLPYEAARIVLIFFGNLFQYTYLRTTNCECPFCPGQISSTHFFLCPHTPPPYNDWSSVTNAFSLSDYRAGIDKIFLTLQRWAAITNKFQPGFGAKVEEYFYYTQSQVVSRNAALIAGLDQLDRLHSVAF
jgi:hypothetical protein